LVKLLKSGDRRVYINDLKKKYGVGKNAVVRITRQYPDVLARYRADKKQVIKSTLDHFELAIVTGTELPNWESLLSDVLNTPKGDADATNYHLRIEKLLSALFSPDMAYPEIEQPIHEGRKRIDITYTNVATQGFFKWVGDHTPAPYIFIECKNYSRDVANPELDQISGRFSPRRGRFGIIVCRKLENKNLFLKRCRDTADDDRGFIVPLDDEDLKILVKQIGDVERQSGEYPLLKEIYDRLVL
jgi:hypothetical protein